MHRNQRKKFYKLICFPPQSDTESGAGKRLKSTRETDSKKRKVGCLLHSSSQLRKRQNQLAENCQSSANLKVSKRLVHLPSVKAQNLQSRQSYDIDSFFFDKKKTTTRKLSNFANLSILPSSAVQLEESTSVSCFRLTAISRGKFRIPYRSPKTNRVEPS